MSTNINSIRIKGAEAVSQLDVMTEILGDILAERYALDDSGMDAIVYHLVQKHHWLPRIFAT